MRPERVVVGGLIKIILVAIVLGLFYVAVTMREQPIPQLSGRQNSVQRVLEALQKGLHVKAPYLSEENIRQKIRRYMK
jgi:hypothetical protein